MTAFSLSLAVTSEEPKQTKREKGKRQKSSKEAKKENIQDEDRNLTQVHKVGQREKVRIIP